MDLFYTNLTEENNEVNKNFKKRQKTGRSVDAAFISMRRMHQYLSRFIEQ